MHGLFPWFVSPFSLFHGSTEAVHISRNLTDGKCFFHLYLSLFSPRVLCLPIYIFTIVFFPLMNQIKRLYSRMHKYFFRCQYLLLEWNDIVYCITKVISKEKCLILRKSEAVKNRHFNFSGTHSRNLPFSKFVLIFNHHFSNITND